MAVWPRGLVAHIDSKLAVRNRRGRHLRVSNAAPRRCDRERRFKGKHWRIVG